VFPEGTRSVDGTLGPLRAGTFQIALAGPLPVQPLAIFGAREAMPRRALAPLRRTTIVVRVGEPISVDGLSGGAGRKILAERVRAAFAQLGVGTTT
jgi:1-acyl-sn-glycerol-3-phosphate acyltransferase